MTKERIMSLVERLRRQVEFLVEVWCGDLENPEHEGLRLYREAANEIERLQNENNRMRSALKQIDTIDFSRAGAEGYVDWYAKKGLAK